MQALIPIIPAIIPTSHAELEVVLKQLQGIPEIHVDVVDGNFVPTISWPYEPVGEPKSLISLLNRFSLEVDLMVRNPLMAAEAWVSAGADQLVFHVETISVEAFQEYSDRATVSVGVCALMDTPDSVLEPYLAYADYVQVMGIAKIGNQGQPFDDRVFDRILWLRATAPQLPISIDGSVNAMTLPKIIPYELDRYIVGSAIVKQPNPRQAYSELVNLVQSTGK